MVDYSAAGVAQLVEHPSLPHHRVQRGKLPFETCHAAEARLDNRRPPASQVETQKTKPELGMDNASELNYLRNGRHAFRPPSATFLNRRSYTEGNLLSID